MSCFRQSKRRAAFVLEQDPQSTGLSRLVGVVAEIGRRGGETAYDELVRQLPQQAVLYIDESPTKEGKTKSWIWTFVAATFTLFATRTSRAADILADWLEEGYRGVIHCDR